MAGDWRHKIKAAKKQEKRSAKKAAKVKSTASVDLDALTATLPSNWQAMRDPASGEIYYGNPVTKVSSQSLEFCVGCLGHGTQSFGRSNPAAMPC